MRQSLYLISTGRLTTIPYLITVLASVANAAFPARLSDLTRSSLSNKYAMRFDVARDEFSISCGGSQIHGDVPKQSALDSYINVFASEWNLYPRRLVAQSELKRVVFCSHLTLDDQPRLIQPTFDYDTLYVDVECAQYDNIYCRKIIHHEFFHIIDFQDDGILADSTWESLNPEGFRYGVSRESIQSSRFASVWNPKLRGFLNNYSTIAVEEDKAEIFAHLMVCGPAVAARARTDKVIRSKCDRIKALIRSFCSEADEQFWQAAEALKRTRD